MKIKALISIEDEVKRMVEAYCNDKKDKSIGGIRKGSNASDC